MLSPVLCTLIPAMALILLDLTEQHIKAAYFWEVHTLSEVLKIGMRIQMQKINGGIQKEFREVKNISHKTR